MRNRHVSRQPKNKAETPKKGKGAPYDRKKLKDDERKKKTDDGESNDK